MHSHYQSSNCHMLTVAAFDAGRHVRYATKPTVHRRRLKERDKRNDNSYIFDYDDALLCDLVSDDVEYVMTPDNAVLHLSITANIWIIRLYTSNSSSDLCRLHSSHTERVYAQTGNDKLFKGILHIIEPEG